MIRKVIILTPTIGGADGLSTLARQVVGAIGSWPLAQRAELHVWSLHDQPAAESALDARVRCFSARGSKLRYLRWGLVGALRSQQETLIVATHLGLAPVAVPMCRRGARLAVFLLGVECWRELRRRETRAIRRAKLLLPISHHTWRRFAEANPGLVELPHQVCHLGVADLEQVKTIGDSASFALIVGRMASAERYKGHDELLEVWPEVLRALPQARLVIAGDGDDRPRLVNKAADLGLNGSVTFLGRVSDSRLNELYEQCTFVAMPSRNEGFGYVFVEAMRAGKPCIGAPGAAEEIIENGVTGLVLDSTERSLVRDAIIQLFCDPGMRHRMSVSARNVFKERFTESHFRDRLTTGLVDTWGS